MNYKKIYDQIVQNRIKNIAEGYVECHHIIPVSLGGKDVDSNIVKLSAREHFVCHLLLLKMQRLGSPDYYKMLNAFVMMCWCHGENQERYYISSKLYEAKKKEFSEWKSKSMLGENNHQFGSVWCVKRDAVNKNQRKKFKKDQIPEDWISCLEWTDSRKNKENNAYGRSWYNDGKTNYYLSPTDSKVFTLLKGRIGNLFKREKSTLNNV